MKTFTYCGIYVISKGSVQFAHQLEKMRPYLKIINHCMIFFSLQLQHKHFLSLLLHEVEFVVRLTVAASSRKSIMGPSSVNMAKMCAHVLLNLSNKIFTFVEYFCSYLYNICMSFFCCYTKWSL